VAIPRAIAGAERAARLARCLGSIATLKSARELTALLALPESSGVDGRTAE
jgi:hypothetical protein